MADEIQTAHSGQIISSGQARSSIRTAADAMAIGPATPGVALALALAMVSGGVVVGPLGSAFSDCRMTKG